MPISQENKEREREPESLRVFLAQRVNSDVIGERGGRIVNRVLTFSRLLLFFFFWTGRKKIRRVSRPLIEFGPSGPRFLNNTHHSHHPSQTTSVVLRERERCLALSLFHRISFSRSSRRGGKNRKTFFQALMGTSSPSSSFWWWMCCFLAESFLRCSQVNNNITPWRMDRW